jgi:hypothetical protein
MVAEATALLQDHQQALVDRLLTADAVRADVGQPTTGPDAVPWVVLGDPEGNEFCVLEPREVYRDTGPVAAVVIPATDADALAAFWQQATGRERTDRHFPSLRAPSGGPFLEFLPDHPAPAGPARLHLDVRPSPGNSQVKEVRRLTALGAARTASYPSVRWRRPNPARDRVAAAGRRRRPGRAGRRGLAGS